MEAETCFFLFSLFFLCVCFFNIRNKLVFIPFRSIPHRVEAEFKYTCKESGQNSFYSSQHNFNSVIAEKLCLCPNSPDIIFKDSDLIKRRCVVGLGMTATVSAPLVMLEALIVTAGRVIKSVSLRSAHSLKELISHEALQCRQLRAEGIS